jgi:membrane protease YdiL (CAAX protease family)
MRYPSTVPRKPGADKSELAQSAVIAITTAAYIWLAASKAPWAVVFPIALVLLLWRKQQQTLDSLGLRFSAFILSLSRWRVLWILAVALFLTLGWHLLFNLNILARGGIYFAWCFVQQLIYQSVVYSVLRKTMKPWAAALISGIVFALLHIPNPVLILGTLLWGVVSCLLFENCRTVLGLALLQVMFSSTLMWLTPVELHHRFRIGPSYYLLHPVPSP